MITEEARQRGHAAMRQKGDRTRQAIAGAITDYWAEHQIAPTVRDIQAACDISSPSVVWHHLAAMEQQGTITRQAGIPRSLRVVRS